MRTAQGDCTYFIAYVWTWLCFPGKEIDFCSADYCLWLVIKARTCKDCVFCLHEDTTFVALFRATVSKNCWNVIKFVWTDFEKIANLFVFSSWGPFEPPISFQLQRSSSLLTGLWWWIHKCGTWMKYTNSSRASQGHFRTIRTEKHRDAIPKKLSQIQGH